MVLESQFLTVPPCRWEFDLSLNIGLGSERSIQIIEIRPAVSKKDNFWAAKKRGGFYSISADKVNGNSAANNMEILQGFGKNDRHMPVPSTDSASN